MCRAGSDIGYCDSDWRENNTIDIRPSDSSVENYLSSMGFDNVDVRTGDNDLDISFTYKGVFYAHYDLDWDSYENFEFVDYLSDADQKESACCGATLYDDSRRCGYCKESL